MRAASVWRLGTARSRAIVASMAASAGVLLLAGCHHRARVSGTPTPPPAAGKARGGTRDADADGAGAERGSTGAPSRRPPASPGADRGTSPLPPLSVHGEPFATEVGLASWYGPPYAGRRGADGTVYDQNAMTAAHLTLALGTVVRVTNLINGQSAVVRITDRGPFVKGRIIDLSLAAAKATGVYRAGVSRVRVEAFAAPAPKPGVYAGGRWCVQIGAFPTEADATQEKLELAGRYPEARVIDFAGPTGFWVRINPRIADYRHASAVADSIHLPDAAQPYLTRTD